MISWILILLAFLTIMYYLRVLLLHIWIETMSTAMSFLLSLQQPLGSRFGTSKSTRSMMTSKEEARSAATAATILVVQMDGQQQEEKTEMATARRLHSSPLLSVIIPAYNEQERLPLMLQPAYDYLISPNCPALQHLLQLRKSGHHHHLIHSPIDGEDGDNDKASILTIEWIVVSDGSTDQTEQVYRDFCASRACVSSSSSLSFSTTNSTSPFPSQERQQHLTLNASRTQMIWKFLPLPVNQGKGGAVRAGMLTATGYFCLMVDADGASRFDHLDKLTRQMLFLVSTNDDDSAPLCQAWGSRAHLQNTTTIIQRSFLRTLLMKGFHALVHLICTTRSNTPRRSRESTQQHNQQHETHYHRTRPSSSSLSYIHDTQCGFKLFPQHVAQTLFSQLHLKGWAFDIELYILSSLIQIPIVEVPIDWQEIEGSKLHTSPFNVVRVAMSMLWDMLLVRFCYETGIWKIYNNSNDIKGKQTEAELAIRESAQ